MLLYPKLKFIQKVRQKYFFSGISIKLLKTKIFKLGYFIEGDQIES